MGLSFIPGLELNQAFFLEIIQPLMQQHFPQLQYSAGLLGYGSDVLGMDTATSMDHNWGPRCLLFLSETDFDLRDQISECMSRHLPFSFKGFPTHYSDPRYDGTQAMQETHTYPIRHFIEIYSVEDYFQTQLNIRDINRITIQEWMTFSDQVLLELNSGSVFHDGLNKLNNIRKSLEFYPPDIQKLRLAALWDLVCNEEAFIGRCRETGDKMGLKIISNRIVNTLIKILYYIFERYIPYSKWMTKMFESFCPDGDLLQHIMDTLYEKDATQIENKLSGLYTRIIDIHNQHPALPHLDNIVRDYFGRLYRVIFAETIVSQFLDSIPDPEIRQQKLSHIALDIKLDGIDATA